MALLGESIGRVAVDKDSSGFPDHQGAIKQGSVVGLSGSNGEGGGRNPFSLTVGKGNDVTKKELHTGN